MAQTRHGIRLTPLRTLDDLGESHRPLSDHDDDNDDHTTPPPKNTFFGQLLDFLWSRTKGRKGRHDIESEPILAPLYDQGRTQTPREIRRFRRTMVVRTLKRSMFATPILLLLFLYVYQLYRILRS